MIIMYVRNNISQLITVVVILTCNPYMYVMAAHIAILDMYVAKAVCPAIFRHYVFTWVQGCI